ncbi:MAG: helix-turn-helix domain-containing protein, partial [Pirellulaceae bacterium]|nr:helix-turn-helix domain-containing protein [Pirellulaceae bacterium]
CLCSLSVPPLTSIDLFPQRIGYEASEMLDAMMEGKTVPEHQLVAPSHIEVRGSTDVLVTSDAKVRAAVQFIRENACQGIQVRDVLRYVKLSRTALAPRIKAVLGRTTYQEIQRIQVQRIKELLVATDASTKQIARMAGFHYPEYMMRVFRKATGKTPTEYRKSMRSQRY